MKMNKIKMDLLYIENFIMMRLFYTLKDRVGGFGKQMPINNKVSHFAKSIPRSNVHSMKENKI